MSYMINLTNIIGEFPAWNLSTETRKNKYLEFEAPKRKFQRELNILNYTKCSVRDLSFFAKYPLLKKIISFLQDNVETQNMDIALFLEIAILLAYHVKLSAKSVTNSINYFLKCRNELTNSTHKISLAGLEILDEITALIRECELGLIDKSSSLLKKKLFKDEDSINFGEERLYPNDCIFGYLLQEHISGYLLCLVTEPFVELFYTNTSSVNPCFTLFNALCFKGEIKSFITKDENLSYSAIIKQKDNPLATCLAVTLDKITSSNRISSQWILDNISQNYITTFRKLWWLSSIYAKYHSKYSNELNNNRNLFAQVEKIIKLVELESGKKLVMPDNYPISNVFPETMEMKKESPDGKKGVTELGVYYSQREKDINSLTQQSNNDKDRENSFFILPDDYFEQLSDSCERICIDDIKEIIKKQGVQKFYEFIDYIAEQEYIENDIQTKKSFAYRLTGRHKPDNLLKKIEWNTDKDSGSYRLYYIVKQFYWGNGRKGIRKGNNVPTGKYHRIKLFFICDKYTGDPSTYANKAPQDFKTKLEEFFTKEINNNNPVPQGLPSPKPL